MATPTVSFPRFVFQLTYRDARPRMPAVTAHKSTQQIDAFDESGEPTVSTAIRVLTNCYCTGILTSDPVTQATLN
ncbi:MAG TPA: hypothetical protein VM120_03205 [Bryobacteraceae bacterium]|nr:hypothetical protein [Bryobacteraceae bacterium]